MPGGDAVALLEPGRAIQADVVEERAVLAAEIAQVPFLALAFEGQMLPRKPGVVRKTKLGGAGAPKGQTLTLQRDNFVLTVRAMDPDFVGVRRGHHGLVYLRRANGVSRPLLTAGRVPRTPGASAIVGYLERLDIYE